RATCCAGVTEWSTGASTRSPRWASVTASGATAPGGSSATRWRGCAAWPTPPPDLPTELFPRPGPAEGAGLAAARAPGTTENRRNLGGETTETLPKHRRGEIHERETHQVEPRNRGRTRWGDHVTVKEGRAVQIDTGTTAWMLTATALVLLMTPGLSLFYGGMTRAKSVLNMMMMSFSAIIVVTVIWLFFGHSLAFTENPVSAVNSFVGGFDALGLQSLVETATADDGTGMPSLVFSAFQLTFAIITVALISGAIADRAKFGAWVLFAAVWATIVYFPVAHWVWGG